MSNPPKHLVQISITSALLSCASPAELHRLKLPPQDGEAFKEANYALWLPGGGEKVRTIIVHQHGCGDGAQNAGRTAADDLHWRLLAEHTGSALLGTSLWPKGTCRDWCDPAGGSGRAFLEALERFATESGHDELRTVPWVVWGHSGGGFWTHRMLRSHPGRFAGAVLQSAGFGTPEEWPLPKLSDGVPTDVPMLIHVGEGESGHERFGALYRNGIELFRELRAEGAPVALAVDPKSGHGCGDSRYLTIPWILGILGDGAPAGVEAPTPRSDTTSWLPDGQVLEVWKEFVSAGSVGDTTPPAHPPTDLKAEVVRGEGVVLTWGAKPDLQSGIQTFRIYNGDQLLPPYSAPGREQGQTTDTFRKPNYSDTPNRPLSEMRYVLQPPAGERSWTLRVSTVNWAGLESAKSEPLEWSGK